MLEIACFTRSSAIAAARAGADRMELCKDYAAGGLTPDIEDVRALRREIDGRVNVMIRPRPGDFKYSEEEFEVMEFDIQRFKDDAHARPSGFVFGILDSQHRVDETRNKALVQLAAPLPCTFHRAIDEVEDIDDAVEKVIACGFKSILTSGGAKSAVEGAERVAQLQKKVGEKIDFILGGGIRSNNIRHLKRITSVPWLHSAAITSINGEEVDDEEVKKLQRALQTST